MIASTRVSRDAVTLVEGPASGARIVGYLLPERDPEDATAWARDVRAHAAASLPDGLVPAELRAVERVPLTPNGKLDRRSLAGPLDGGADDYVPPRDETERRVAGMCAELLGAERVGATDNLFLLGGHSLMIAQLGLRVEAALGVRVPLWEIFIDPTVARIAATVTRLRVRPDGTDPADQAADWGFAPVTRS